MKVTIEDLSPVKKKIMVELPSEDVDREFNAAYKELKEGASIDGFRKGKAPKAVLESRYKDSVLGGVGTKLIENSYQKVIEEKKLSLVAQPEIEVISSIEEGQPFSYNMTLEIKPIVNVEGYIGIKLKRERVTVGDDDIEKGMELLRERSAYVKEVERPAQDRDLVIMGFEGFYSDGKPIESTKASDYPVVIGTHALSPAIEDALKGMKKGDEKEIKMPLPEGFKHEKLAGKEVVFKVKVKGVKERILPAIDDEFAKDLKFDNIAQLKDRVKEGLTREKEGVEKERLRKEAIDKLIEQNKFDAPPSLVANYLQSFVSKDLERIGKGNLGPEELSEMETNPEKLKENYAVVADARVRGEMILDAIARQENITVSEDEINLRIKAMAAQRHQSVDEFKKQLAEHKAESMVAVGMLEEKVFDFIMAKADITVETK
ncbi:MAG TPA: trigger factor [Thermodesulfobacteriota bacterium]|nr:trigger factor [Thermodesulfobacteriota bacterium]